MDFRISFEVKVCFRYTHAKLCTTSSISNDRAARLDEVAVAREERVGDVDVHPRGARIELWYAAHGETPAPDLHGERAAADAVGKSSGCSSARPC